MKISTEFNKKINLPMRSLLGCGGAIAFAVASRRELALRRNRCFEGVGVRSLLGMLGVRFIFGIPTYF
jgi:hypothetical protein